VRQLDAIAARLPSALASQAPIISAGEPVGYLDIDDTIWATFGRLVQPIGTGGHETGCSSNTVRGRRRNATSPPGTLCPAPRAVRRRSAMPAVIGDA